MAGALSDPDRPDAPSFVEILRTELGPGYRITAAGCPGSSVRDWTEDEATLACSMGGAYPLMGRPNLPADIVVVLLGSNDAVGFTEPSPVEPEEYARRMDRLTGRIAADGGREILLVGPPPGTFPRARPEPAERLRGYTEALRALAARHPHVHMGPALLEVLSRGDHFLPRKIHMNAAGHRAVAEALAPQLEALAATLPEHPAPETPDTPSPATGEPATAPSASP